MTKLYKPTIYSPEIPDFVLRAFSSPRCTETEVVNQLVMLALPDRCANPDCTATTCEFSIEFKDGRPVSRYGAYCSLSCEMKRTVAKSKRMT